MSKGTICLWYERNAEEAARFYTEIFPQSHLGAIHKAPSDYPDGKTGDTLVVEFERKVSISERIDQIEEDEMLAENLSYDSDLSSLTLELPDHQLRLRMTASAIEVTVPRVHDIGLLLNNYKKATEMLTGAGIRLLRQG